MKLEGLYQFGPRANLRLLYKILRITLISIRLVVNETYCRVYEVAFVALNVLSLHVLNIIYLDTKLFTVAIA